MLYQTQAAPQRKFNGLTCDPNSNRKERSHCSCSQNNKNSKHISFRKFLIWNCRCSYEYTLASKHAPNSLKYLFFPLSCVSEGIYIKHHFTPSAETIA